MVSSGVIVSAACLLVFQVCRIQSQSISSESYAASCVSGPSQCGGGQIIIPAIIKPVMQSEAPCPAPAPYTRDFCGSCGGCGACAMPPIIFEEGGNGKNDILLPLILILALKNNGGCQCGNSGCGGCNYPMPSYGYGCCGCNCNPCCCGKCCPSGCCCCDCCCCDCCCNDVPTVNIVVSQQEPSSPNSNP